MELPALPLVSGGLDNAGDPSQRLLHENGRVREDGRSVHDMYFVQVKTPAESKSAWDYYKVLATIPGNEAFRPLNENGCPLIKQQ
jgi:branched-chain amino acid transport system substrate-binding protein